MFSKYDHKLMHVLICLIIIDLTCFSFVLLTPYLFHHDDFTWTFLYFLIFALITGVVGVLSIKFKKYWINLIPNVIITLTFIFAAVIEVSYNKNFLTMFSSLSGVLTIVNILFNLGFQIYVIFVTITIKKQAKAELNANN